MSVRLIALLLGSLLAPFFAAAQNSALDDIRDMEDSLYPDFVRGGERTEPAESPTAPAYEGQPFEIAPVPTPPPTPMPLVLAADLESTATWRAARNRLDPAFEELRVLLISNANETEFQDQVSRIGEELDLLAAMGPYQAPNQAEAIAYRTGLLKGYMKVLGENRRAGDRQQIMTSDSLISRTMAELRQLMMDSDAERLDPRASLWSLPGGWSEPRLTLPDFQLTMAAWDAERLHQAYAIRLSEVRRRLRKDPETWQPRLAAELSEIARALARRTNEMPVSSQEGFRNAALRLDVLSEVLYDYMREENYLYLKRHVRLTEQAWEQVDAYFKIKQRGF